MEQFSTKQKGDIAEYRVVAELLKLGLNVLMPCGDRLPYDLVIERNGKFSRLQVKWAWQDRSKDAWFYCVDLRSSNTNRVKCFHSKHGPEKVDFVVAWIAEWDTFYVIPSIVAAKYRSTIRLSMNEKHPVKKFKNAWSLLL